MKNKKLFIELARTAVAAGDAIMEIYSGEFNVELKDDNSPLTAADKASHNIIADALSDVLYMNESLPLLSEEGDMPAYELRQNWNRFWLIDPLDGTKEFISRNGEFTVNIALIETGHPKLGIVYLPVKRLLYFGGAGYGTFRTAADDVVLENVLKLPVETGRDRTILTAAGSRSHRSSDFDGWVEAEAARRGCSSIKIITAGSSLKFCLAAEGLVDVYPRFGPTMEWDTAAAHAVVEGAGKQCCCADGSRMLYNKPDMRNGHFIVK
ncbi:MAG: 3'(2'),5'-bisphosphate nucleotidase CysQ [Spirochaetales bacterium]|uniref:3'(2'),5'-bisphosphate nucleotidase CysQ n=1 Tax=Candidatus Thalassospirochaeta sargassi TaxID=3119039 RepID=A0AAJ1IAM5_9SPIO|nr:3'(2'),5'-bisphosphate nucleotidase CysQ [Spirochaetales bacterium]